ncbi:LysR family transcriptional regulator [Parvibacter caecicola]|uniref:LysR family transcriptional regulator n=1 Tax=Parvibacter caecicola TaxID=747645 RepID=UPI00272FB99F|nr:LysR family transcriptional regulator [Parvibacter caecicola]
MELDYLREFIELSKGKSISQTARELNTSQSALSRHLQVLESEFKAELLTRLGNDTQLTPEGEVVLDLAKSVIGSYDRVVDAFAHNVSKNQDLTISGHVDAPEDSVLFLNASRALMAFSGDATVRFSSPNSRNEIAYRDALLSGDVGVVFLWGNILRFFKDDTVFSSRVIVSRPWKVVVEKSNPLAHKGVLTLQDLAGQTLIHFVGERYTSSWRSLESFLAKKGVPVKERLVRCASLYDYLTTPLEGAALMFPPPSNTLLNDEERGTVMLDIEADESFALNMYAIFRKSCKQELIEQYLDLVEREFAASMNFSDKEPIFPARR